MDWFGLLVWKEMKCNYYFSEKKTDDVEEGKYMTAGWFTEGKLCLELWWEREGIASVWMCSGGCKIRVCIYDDFVHGYIFTWYF